jgi:hypothetical protein
LRKHEIEAAIMYLRKVYPRAVIVKDGIADHRWPEARQMALREQLERIEVSFEQFGKVVNDISMNSRGWCPPEDVILKRLRGLGQVNVQAGTLTDRQRLAARMLGDNPDVLREYAEDFRQLDNDSRKPGEPPRFFHWPDHWFIVTDPKAGYTQHHWSVKFLAWVEPKLDLSWYANQTEDRRTVQGWTRAYTADSSLQNNLTPYGTKGLAKFAGSKERRERKEFDDAI